MPKAPLKSEPPARDDEDYEIVSFEEFCDKSPGSKTDLLTLNDNINYRFCYEAEKSAKFVEDDGATSSRDAEQSETALNGSKNVTFKRRLSNFAPFGRFHGKNARGTPFSGVIPKARTEGESSREHRYQRFSSRRNVWQRAWDSLPSYGSGMLLVGLVCALCAGAYWAVCGAVGQAWGEEHYKRLWERAHPDNIKKPPTPITYEKILPEYRYHDHNNLSTKNKNATELAKKKPDPYKKAYTERPPEVMSGICAQVEDNMRFDCYPQDNSNEKDCVERGCCWRPTATKGAPYCFYPPQYDSYRFVNMTENKHGMTVHYERSRPSGYPGDFEVARMDFKYLSDDVLQIKIYDAENKRFEPPYPEIPLVPEPISDLKYRVQVESATVGFKIVRNSDNVTIINTQDVGGLILSDKFLQLSAILPSDHIYGLGERQSRFKLDTNWQTYTLFNYDTAPRENTNLYGSHPFYLNLEPGGNSHGMLLLNSYAMDVVLQPTPAITYRATGGVLDLFVLAGPAPAAAAAQYAALVGKPAMPPYWALGFHLCKFGYGSLNVTQDVWQKNREAGIPFDVQWNDLDYMNNSNDFTYDKVKFAGLPQFVEKVHHEGMHYVVLIDPGVSAGETPGEYPPFDRGLELDIFVKNSTNHPFIGKTWNKVSTAYPDFTHPSSTAYWVEMMTALHEQIPFDGAWIDMNEPSNMLSGPLHGSCAPEDLPYKPRVGGGELKSKTLCMDAVHYGGKHDAWHNLYALTEAMATHFALTEIRGTRPFIISRATFVGSGHYAGHWSGDVTSAWHDMAASIPDMLSFSLFGIPMMGADICGFNGDTTVELCKRWMQLGAFYPFSRNHNSIGNIPQDPVSLGPEVVEASRTALRMRYRLLPYYYTLFWRAHVFGETVVRPLFFESPQDPVTYDIDTQFLVGPHVMVSPILEQGARTTRGYFPDGPWFNLAGGARVADGRWQMVADNATVTVKAGGILPLQEPPPGPASTSNSRSGPLQLLAAPRDRRARGELYWDHGDTLNSYEEKKYSHFEFLLTHTELKSVVHWWGHGVPTINKVTLLDQSVPTSVTVNGAPCQKPRCEFTYTAKTQVLEIYNMNLALDKPFSIKWTYRHQFFKANRVEKSTNDTLVSNLI